MWTVYDIDPCIIYLMLRQTTKFQKKKKKNHTL